MTRTNRRAWAIAFCLGMLPGALSAQTRAAVGYAEGGVLYLLSSSGEQLNTIRTSRPIREFAVSPDASRIVFSSAPLSSYGGQLYTLRLSTGELSVLGHIRGVSTSIFSDPEFSPDGRRIAFAVHGSRNGDLVEASGPLAVADVNTGTGYVLRATQDIDGNGPAFANEPHWSPDSHWLLFSFEIGAAIVDSKGQHLRKLTSIEGDSSQGWSHAVGWVGSRCIAYIAGATPTDAQKKPLNILRLKDHQTLAADRIFGTAHLTNLVAFSPKIQVFKTPSGFEVHTNSSTWRLPAASTRAVAVGLVPNPESGEIPGFCR